MITNALQSAEWRILERLLMPANALAVEVMLETGLRVSDVLNLRTEQLKSTRLTVCECKTGKTRLVTLSKSLLDRLKRQSGCIYVFESPQKAWKHRTRQAVWTDIKRAAKAMRIDLNVAPHSARKTYACDMYRKTGDIKAVQALLNHDNVGTTVLYLVDAFAANFGGLDSSGASTKEGGQHYERSEK